MKGLILSALLLLAQAGINPGGGSPGVVGTAAYVKHAQAGATEWYIGATSSIYVDFATATTTGNAIIVGVGGYDNGGPTEPDITDNQGNSYTQVGYVVSGGVNYTLIAYCLNANGGAGHRVTATPTSGNNDMQITAVEVSGVGAYAGMDNSSPYTGVTSQAGDFLFAHADKGSTPAPTLSWTGSTALSASTFGRSAYEAVVTGAAETVTTTGDTAVIARFSAEVTGGGAGAAPATLTTFPSISPEE